MNTLVPKTVVNSKYNEAAEQIKESMHSILPKNTKVKLSYIDDGAFGYGYKIEFLDREGKKVFKDSVLKLYKDEQIDNKFQGMVLEMI